MKVLAFIIYKNFQGIKISRMYQYFVNLRETNYWAFWTSCQIDSVQKFKGAMIDLVKLTRKVTASMQNP